ncbi:hypothetical protein E4T43_05586 [Aureobasidium subglaciale]|nr:hypothetical protein E4T43_05586 [Aureobasidium subglaciale]
MHDYFYKNITRDERHYNLCSPLLQENDKLPATALKVTNHEQASSYMLLISTSRQLPFKTLRLDK